MSIRRACSNLLLDTSAFHYRSRRPDQAALKERIKDICETRVRYGYRRVHVMLRREGWFVNQKKVRRLYNELGLQLRNKHPKRKVRAKLIRDRKEAVSPLEVLAMDFVHDQLATGRQFATFLGLTPRQNSSGGKERFGRISKMGDGYLRRLLVVGATSVIQRADTNPSATRAWVRSLLTRKPARLTTVAMANKTARIAWAVLARSETYRAPVMA